MYRNPNTKSTQFQVSCIASRGKEMDALCLGQQFKLYTKATCVGDSLARGLAMYGGQDTTFKISFFYGVCSGP